MEKLINPYELALTYVERSLPDLSRGSIESARVIFEIAHSINTAKGAAQLLSQTSLLCDKGSGKTYSNLPWDIDSEELRRRASEAIHDILELLRVISVGVSGHSSDQLVNKITDIVLTVDNARLDRFTQLLNEADEIVAHGIIEVRGSVDE